MVADEQRERAERQNRLSMAISRANQVLVRRTLASLDAVMSGRPAQRSYYSDDVILATLAAASRDPTVLHAVLSAAQVAEMERL